MKNSTKLCALCSLMGLLLLTGCPIPPSLSPKTLTFAPQVVDPLGAASVPQTVTLKAGTSAVTVGTITVTGPYSQTNDCPSTLPASASCAIQVTFAPNAVGIIAGGLQVGTGVTRSVSLTGTGLPPVGFSPGNLDFGTVAIGGTAAAQPVTVTNNQTAALAITGISVSGDYSQANDCPASLQAGATCTINVSFQPTVNGTVAGAVSVMTDAALSAQPVGLTGVGSGTAASAVLFTPASLDFGPHEDGTTSSPRTITLKNTSSSSSLTITSIAASVGYGTTDTCAGTTLSPNGTCTITATFKPTADLVTIAYPGAITVVDGDATSPQVIALAGTGVAPVSSSPTTLDFGAILYNSTSAAQTVTLTNYDNNSETLTLATSGPVGVPNNNCGSSLPSSGKCSLSATFGPGALGPATGSITAGFSSGGFLNPHVTSVAGCFTEVARTPQRLNFGAVSVGQTSSPETTTISGGGFNFSGFTLSGTNASEFAIANNTCGSTLSGQSCSLDVTFTPATPGAKTASVDIADDQHCSPQSVSLVAGSSAGPFVVTGILNGTGSGNLASTPTGLNCGSQGTACSVDFASGSAVTVKATPDANSTFAGWGGACSGTGPCNLTMNADRQVSATFMVNPSLSVSIGGNLTGKGTVTSSPAGINCQMPQGNSACQAYYSPGTSVMLTSIPGSGSSFAGWNGDCSGTGTCSITMNADHNVGATFNGPPTLAVGLAGSGAGSVTSSPQGINCPGAQCSLPFPSGTSVTLAATPASGSGFDGWNGPCSGTAACTFTITSDQTVGATFDLSDFTVTVSPATTQTVAPGGSATFNVAIAGLGGLTSAVTLGCSAPTAQGVNCSFSSASAKPGSSVNLTVTTTGPSAALNVKTHSNLLYAMWMYFPVLGIVGIGSVRSKNRRLAVLFLCSVLMGFLALQMACSSGSSTPKNPGTPAGTYTVNINAASGTSLQHNSSVSVTVQ